MLLSSDAEVKYGRKTVGTSPVSLAIDGLGKCSRGILVKVLGTSKTIFIGNAANVAASGANGGYPLTSGEELNFPIRDPAVLFAVATEEVEVAWIAL